MDSDKILSEKETEQVSGGLWASEWQDLAAGAALYHYAGGTLRAEFSYTGENMDPGWAYQQRLKCMLTALHDGSDNFLYDSVNYKVGDVIWIARGDVTTNPNCNYSGRNGQHGGFAKA